MTFDPLLLRRGDALSIGTALLLIAVLVGGAAHALWFWEYVNDDAYIAFRYSLRLARGDGPYFNVGEHVEGYSSLSFMLAMAPVAALFGEGAVPIAAKALGLVSGVSTLVLVAALARRVALTSSHASHSAGAGLLAAALVAASPSFAVNSVNGLETTFYAVVLCLGAYLGARLVERGSGHASGIAFAIAVLSRPEAIAVVAAHAAARLPGALREPGPWRQRPLVARRLVPESAWAVGALAAQLAFRMVAYDGELLPNTYYAKLGGFWRMDAGTYLYEGMLSPYGWLGVLVGLWACFFRATPTVVLPVAAMGVTGALLPFVTGTDWMPGQRLLAPYLPLVACLLGVGWWQMLGVATGERVRWRAAAAALVIVGAWFQTSAKAADMRRGLAMRAAGYRGGHQLLADWLCTERSDAGDTLALMDIGLIGYRCIDRQILDITGLTDRTIAKSPGTFLRKEYDPAYVLERKPRFVILTFTKEGDPTRPPTDLEFQPWTTMERDLYEHPEFQRWYARVPGHSDDSASWLAQTAATYGAVRVFQHLHPGSFYLLVVFERLPVPRDGNP